MNTLSPLVRQQPACSLYQYDHSSLNSSNIKDLSVLIATTPETRAICNDPMICGIEYTRSLQTACTTTLKALKKAGLLDSLKETSTTVFHLLRGGLNFGLRDACSDALQWNLHNAAFASAQRRRVSESDNTWEITEDSYQKLCPHQPQAIIMGDVIGTGTSMKHALAQLISVHKSHNADIQELIFFTIGTGEGIKVAQQLHSELKSEFQSYQRTTMVFFEGIFCMAEAHHELAIKITGTDLLRSEATLAPEFVESQSLESTYPLERCAIYDAGSRAFDLPVYFADIACYWEQVLQLAESGTYTLETYRKERAPFLTTHQDETESLSSLSQKRLEAITQLRLPVVPLEAE